MFHSKMFVPKWHDIYFMHYRKLGHTKLDSNMFQKLILFNGYHTIDIWDILSTIHIGAHWFQNKLYCNEICGHILFPVLIEILFIIHIYIPVICLYFQINFSSFVGKNHNILIFSHSANFSSVTFWYQRDMPYITIACWWQWRHLFKII
jgi:hypothetical protein